MFTKEFYKRLCEEIYKYAENNDEVKDEYQMELYFDGLVIYVTATFNIYWEDDSFDHAFGTQYYEPYAVLGEMTDISDVEVYNEETDEKIDGFSIDDFWTTFDVEEYRGLKKGDNISLNRYKGHVDGTFISYNTENLTYKVMMNNGEKKNVSNVYKVI